MDGTYPKDLTTGGTLSAFDLYYLITQINTQAKMEAIWGVALVNDGDLADYQPLDTALTNLSALTYVSPSFIKLTADDTYAVRTLAEAKEDLDLEIGTDVQAYNVNNAYITDKLSAFAATTSAELAGVISDEIGEGKAVFGVDEILGAMREETFIHTDGVTANASHSTMVWIPRYVTAGFVAQPNLNGINMGGFWVDKYQASQPDSTMASRGSTSANTPGAIPGVSQVLKVPWTNISWVNAKVACENRGASNTSTASAAAGAADELTDTAHLPTYAVGTQIQITLADDGLTYIRRITAFDSAGTTVYFEPDLPSNVASGDSYTIPEYHMITAYEWASLAYLACMLHHDQRVAGTDLPKGNNNYGRDYQDADSPENYGMRDPVEPGTGSGIDRVLTGSGPNTWSLTGHPLGVWDLNGNVWEWIDLLMGGGNSISGVGGTDHIINPGFPEAGLTMPSSNNRIATLEDTDVNGKKAALVKTVGAAVLEYGSDYYYQNTGERAAARGGIWSHASVAGVLLLGLNNAPSSTFNVIGFRAAR